MSPIPTGSPEQSLQPDLFSLAKVLHPSGGELLEQFAPDWHPHYGDRLVVFPRSVAMLHGQPLAGAVCYWPDFATFVEDARSRWLMYYPLGISRYSLCVLYDRASGCWRATKYRDLDVVRSAVGRSFDEIMARAAAFSIEEDEA